MMRCRQLGGCLGIHTQQRAQLDWQKILGSPKICCRAAECGTSPSACQYEATDSTYTSKAKGRDCRRGCSGAWGDSCRRGRGDSCNRSCRDSCKRSCGDSCKRSFGDSCRRCCGDKGRPSCGDSCKTACADSCLRACGDSCIIWQQRFLDSQLA